MKHALFLCATGLCAVLLAACTRSLSVVDVELSGGRGHIKLPLSQTLRVSFLAEPQSLDWERASDSVSAWIMQNLMEGLTQFDFPAPGSGREIGVKPALALRWTPSLGAKRWKFTLRDDVVWSDDQPFTAQQILDGWKRLLDKETAGPYAYFLFCIKNAQAFNQGKVGFNDVGVKITGKNEITVDLERPMAYFPMLLTHTSTFPIRLDVLKKFGNLWTEAGNLVTLGPFKLKSWLHDRAVLLSRNESYYGAKPAVGYVVAYLLQDQMTELSLFEAGRLDAVYQMPSVELPLLKKRKEYRENPVLTTLFYGFNTQKPPLDNVLLRRAIAHAIDRGEIARMMAGGQKPLTSWVPSGMFGFEPDIGLKFDPAEARALLRDAGYTDPKRVPKIEIKFNTLEDQIRIAENIQEQLRRNLGIAVELRNEEWKVFLSELQTDPPQIFRFGWQADYPDPDNFLDLMTGASDNNHSRWKNPRFDELVAKAAGLIDPDERRKIYREAQKILVEKDVAAIPIFSQVSHFMISERVKNYPVNALDQLIFKGVKLK